MQLEQHVDELAATLETGRRRLASVDVGDVVNSARANARAVTPARWRKPKHRARWPLVAGVLIVGAVIAAFTFLLPALRQGIDSRSGRQPDGGPDPIATVPPSDAARANPWGPTSEEKIDGETTGF